ncbi:MAG TPA: hypothetical protein DE179_03405 [Oceanospirillaceae bacterium]|nr:hypothetical protein [Oceanospirillaceae bacterium]
MLFAFYCQDVENSLEKRLAARPDHLARLTALNDAGRLVLAGPNPNPDADGFTGSLVVADFADMDAALAWANDDPYMAAGVYEGVIVKPFKQVFPAAE